MIYKFTRVYIVEGESEDEARDKCQENPAKFLTYSSTQVLKEQPKEEKSWGRVAREQVIGK